MNIGFREDMTHEFKSDRKKLADQEIIDAVVAFANTDGGDLYLGVEDDGEITGLHKDIRILFVWPLLLPIKLSHRSRSDAKF